MSADARLERYAELAVRVGANVAEGQTLFVLAQVEHAPLVRAVARAAYTAGAREVDVQYVDQHVRRAMIELGPQDMLEHTPPWIEQRVESMADQALLSITGDPEPDLLADLPGALVGRARMRRANEIIQQQMADRSLNWTIVAAPNAGWATRVFGEPDVERLWSEVELCMRLDEPDPVAAWQAHLARLRRRADALNELGLDALCYSGPGTDLTVGLLPGVRWTTALHSTRGGREYVANMPTEEVYTSPDSGRAEGSIAASMPLALGGTLVQGLRLTVRDGRIVDVQADRGADVVRAQLETDERAAYFGELALVDRSSRVGQRGITFFDTLYDENATCHIAYGRGATDPADATSMDGVNQSLVHTDFMVGRPELEIDGLRADGGRVPILRGGAWQLPE
ncbi:MAG TPA: aminopeptidase [Gaiellales bacterium]|nr:aminopeptidase [Gaiellales bacterium]